MNPQLLDHAKHVLPLHCNSCQLSPNLTKLFLTYLLFLLKKDKDENVSHVVRTYVNRVASDLGWTLYPQNYTAVANQAKLDLQYLSQIILRSEKKQLAVGFELGTFETLAQCSTT